jgi:hypothetical protein
VKKVMLRQSIKLIEHVSVSQPLKHQLKVADALEERLIAIPTLSSYVVMGKLRAQVRAARETAILNRRTCYDFSKPTSNEESFSWEKLMAGGAAAQILAKDQKDQQEKQKKAAKAKWWRLGPKLTCCLSWRRRLQCAVAPAENGLERARLGRVNNHTYTTSANSK